MGTGYYGPSSTDKLCRLIEVCTREWGDDPTYYNAAQKLREVVRELDALAETPASRQAARAANADQTGQDQYRERTKRGR